MENYRQNNDNVIEAYNLFGNNIYDKSYKMAR